MNFNLKLTVFFCQYIPKLDVKVQHSAGHGAELNVTALLCRSTKGGWLLTDCNHSERDNVWTGSSSVISCFFYQPYLPGWLAGCWQSLLIFGNKWQLNVYLKCEECKLCKLLCTYHCQMQAWLWLLHTVKQENPTSHVADLDTGL